LMQSYCTPVVSPLAASTFFTQNVKDGDFMPPYFIAPYKMDAVNSNVRIILLLPASVLAMKDIHDVSIWMESDPTTLYVRIKITDYMTRLLFFPSLLSFKKRGQPVYPISQMTRFKDGLDEFIFDLRATVHNDVFYTAHIPVESYNVVPDIEDNDWQVIHGGPDCDIAMLIVIMKTPTVAASYFGTRDTLDKNFKGFLDEE